MIKIKLFYIYAKDQILLMILKRKLKAAKKAELKMLDKISKLWQ